MRTASIGVFLLLIGGIAAVTSLAASTSAAGPVQNDAQVGPVTASYRSLAEAGDRDGLAELWLANPGRVLVTIDADLEASLSLWESATEAPDRSRIGALHARALFGAEVAAEARGNPMLRDYASAFIGWSDVQKLDFRAGQAAFGRGIQAMRGGEHEVALSAARECRERALPLGDWWGTAMGLELESDAMRGLSNHEQALATATRARQIYTQLGLSSNALNCAMGALDSAVVLERWQRAHALADDCAKTLAQRGDSDAQAEVLGRRAEIEDTLGWGERAAATRAEAEALGAGR